MPSDATPRVMIIGLDGATLDLIRPWAEAGTLPTFQKLMRQGAWGPLRSIMPPLTPPAWSSFITGMNPGKHGVFDFTAHKEDTHETLLVQSSLRQAPSLWQLASQAGKRVVVYNVPVTYPPERVNGVMASGLMTPPGAKDATFPPELQKELEQQIPGLVLSGHAMFQRGHEGEFVRDLLKIHDDNFRAAEYLMHRQPWDLFVMVFQHTDTMGHFMWKHMEDGGATLPESVRTVAANAMLQCYREVDADLGKLIDEAGEDTNVVVMSDHGHGRIEWYFAVNTWLLQKGYIRLKQDPFTRFKALLYRLGFTSSRAYNFLVKIGIGDKIVRAEDDRVIKTKQRLGGIFLSSQDIDWTRTRAYSAGYCGPIYVNLKGRDPHGIVEWGKEYDSVLDQITTDLQALKDPKTGHPLFPEIHRGRDVYSGPFADRGPDLIFYPSDWRYNAAGRMEFNSNDPISRSGVKTGTHRPEGVLFMRGPGLQEGRQLSSASILDVAPTTLALLGVPVPENMDGRVLEEAMTPDLRQHLSISYTGPELSMPDLVPVAEMSSEEEEILITRLRNLGYIA